MYLFVDLSGCSYPIPADPYLMYSPCPPTNKAFVVLIALLITSVHAVLYLLVLRYLLPSRADNAKISSVFLGLIIYLAMLLAVMYPMYHMFGSA